MADRALYTATTRGITVSVEPTYLDARSSPHDSQYFWAYRVIIENHGRETGAIAEPALDDLEFAW